MVTVTFPGMAADYDNTNRQSPLMPGGSIRFISALGRLVGGMRGMLVR